MMDLSSWKVCLEIGLNHLGSHSLLESIIKDSGIAELGVSVTVQIKEEDFYKTNEQFHLSLEEHQRFIELCRELKIPCGLALGPLSDLQVLKDGGLEPDFIKTLSISSANTDFMGRVYDTYNCPKYISVGLSDVAYVNDHIVPLMGENDKLIHTCLSHNGADQNLGDIRLLGNLGVPVCYGLHALDHDLIYTGIGAGADSIFFYIGDKSLDLPDFAHAIDLVDVADVVAKINTCFSAMSESGDASKSAKINFIG
jgi:sialic acid synthase SpsE